MRNDTEHKSQCAVIKWAVLSQGRFPALKRLFAIPNGGHRDIRVAARLKAEGVRPGVPDLMLPVPRGEYHGLFIEMKAKPNKLTELQEAECAALEASGYCVRVCFSSAEAIQSIEHYITLRE